MRILFADCYGGVSGDMLLAALADLDVSFTPLAREFQQAGFACSYRVKEIVREGIRGKQVFVEVPPGKWSLQKLKFLQKITKISQKGKRQLTQVLKRMLEVEKQIHRTQAPHLHQLGMWDTVADVAGFIYGCEQLQVEEIWFSAIPVGMGALPFPEGEYPNPSPAVLLLAQEYMLLKRAKQSELSTPTGVALLTSLGKQKLEFSFLLQRTGTGFGHREEPGNGLRLWLGRMEEKQEQMIELETVVDDISAEVASGLIDTFLQSGAVEAYFYPVLMKKGRTGFHFYLLCPEDEAQRAMEEIFRQSGTMGIRSRKISRWALERKTVKVDTQYGKIPVKVAYYKGKEIGAKPEFDVCLEKAEKKGVPVKTFILEVLKAYKGSSGN